MFVFFPTQMMPVAKGSTVPIQVRAATQVRCSKCLTPAFFTKYSVPESWKTKQNTRQNSCKNTCMALTTPMYRQIFPIPEGCKSTLLLAPCIFSALDCICLFECCWDWQVASSSLVLFSAVPQWGTWALSTTLQQTFPEDEPDMSTVFGM